MEKSFDDYNYPIEGKENDLCGYEEKEIDFSEDQAKQLGIEPGKKIKVFETDFGKIGIVICWDLRFPYLFKKMKEKEIKINKLDVNKNKYFNIK